MCKQLTDQLQKQGIIIKAGISLIFHLCDLFSCLIRKYPTSETGRHRKNVDEIAIRRELFNIFFGRLK